MGLSPELRDVIYSYLFSIKHTTQEGPVDPRYNVKRLKSIYRQAPSHEDILRNVIASLE